MLTDIGPIEIEVPRDTESTFTPTIVKKRQRRPTGVDQIVLSLSARGLTTGGISGVLASILSIVLAGLLVLPVARRQRRRATRPRRLTDALAQCVSLRPSCSMGPAMPDPL